MPNVTFFGIRNLSDDCAKRIEAPWEWDSSGVDWEIPKGTPWDMYCNNGSTDHLFVSLCEGLVPEARVVRDNQVCAIHGLICDYDGVIPDDSEKLLRKKSPSAYLPQWLVETKSHKARLVWLFEEPVRVPDSDFAKHFLEYVKARVKASHWLSGLDQRSVDPTLYQCVGRKWTPFRLDMRIPSAILRKWAFDVFVKRVERYGSQYGSVEIPMDALKEEARKRSASWGSPPENFSEGAHCRRFWDPESDNERGCIITKHGVYVFVPHNKPFMRWADIFGREFVEHWEAKKFENLPQDLYYESDTGKYWAPDADGRLVPWGRSDMVGRLKVAGLDARTPKGATCSEVDQTLLKIQTVGRIDCAVPYLYHPQGMIPLNDNTKVLNISRIEVVPPGHSIADPKAPFDSPDVSHAFPFLHAVLFNMFGDDKGPDAAPDDPTQLQRLLWWLKVFYQQGYERMGKEGQVLFIAGNASKGKTFLSSQVITYLMGGKPTCASEYLMGLTRFTDSIASQPVMAIDDDNTSVTKKIHETMTLTLKRIAANAQIPWAKKFGAEGTIPWFGRVVVTLNTDPQSLRLIPDLGHSNSDKLLLLLANGERKYPSFSPDRSVNLARTRAELPAFARYLLDLEIPEEFTDPERFGVKGWAHPALIGISDGADSISSLVEYMAIGFKGLGPESGSKLRGPDMKGHYVGSASELYQYLSEGQPSFLRDYSNSRSLGRDLQRMHVKGWDVEPVVDRASKLKKWQIAYDVATKGPSTERAKKAGGV